MTWSEEACETAKRLSAEGRSAGDIARWMLAEHPSITRNAVIGKLHRLGCAGGGRQPNRDKEPGPRSVRLARQAAMRNTVGEPSGCSPRQQGRAKAKAGNDPSVVGEPAFPLFPTSPGTRKGRGVRLRSERRASLIERDAPTSKRSKWIPIWDLKAASCRWPRGDPKDPYTFAYCGALIEGGGPYCSHHHRIARQIGRLL